MTAPLVERLRGREPEYFCDGCGIPSCELCGGKTLRERSADALELCEKALERCRDCFVAYAELHRAKMEYTITREGDAAVHEKVARNQAMADLCDTALATLREGEQS